MTQQASDQISHHEPNSEAPKNYLNNLPPESIEFVDVPPGEDLELNQAIKILIESSGFELKDPKMVTVVENALSQKLDVIFSNARFLGGMQESPEQNKLHLGQLKQALNEEHINIDRPEFVLEQPNLKMTTRRAKIGK